jgi:hypothetical protein
MRTPTVGPKLYEVNIYKRKKAFTHIMTLLPFCRIIII